MTFLKWFKRKDSDTKSHRSTSGERRLPLRQIPAAIVDDAVARLPTPPTDTDAPMTTSAHVQGKGLVQLEFAWTTDNSTGKARWQLVDARQAREDLFNGKAEFPTRMRNRLN